MRFFHLKIRLFCAALVGIGAFLAAQGENQLSSILLPKPRKLRGTGGEFVLHQGLPIVVSPQANARLHDIAELLVDGLRSVAGVEARIESSDPVRTVGAVRLTLTSSGDAPMNPEGYVLRVGKDIELTARDPRGLLWGVQTLLQEIGTRPSAAPFVTCGEIMDEPAYAWRALMLDPVRSFLDLDFIRRTIRVMSAYKLNILHLHLTDDHAWRFESKAFPRVNLPGEPYYTQAELKELVTYAQRYGIEVIPEFDFPGHAHTAVTAYPELDCEGKARPMDQAIFCSAKPFTWEFMDKVLAEAASIFPSPYIHLGADEPFAVKRWETCPDCQARLRAKGVTTTSALYHTFVIDLDALVQRHGKRMIVWNDAIKPGVEPMPPKDILIDAWTNRNDVQTLAEHGYTLVNSSNRPLYLSSYGQREGFPLSAVWQWTPKVFGLREARSSDQDLKSSPLPVSAQVLGGQACLWATDQLIMERRLYPRLLAVAETLWSAEDRGDYAGFTARVTPGQMQRLHRLGVPDEESVPVEIPFADSEIRSDSVARSTEKTYRDFVLTFDRFAEENTGNTGWVIRCDLAQPTVAAAGFVVRSTPPPGKQVVAADVRDLKGWNHFELVARGAVVSLTINGYLAWSMTDPTPHAGPIALVPDRTDFTVKNIRLRPLDQAR
jgi:hexosaminidase